MIIPYKRLEELRKIFAEHLTEIESEEDLDNAGLAITRFVLLKELGKLSKETHDEYKTL